ncbi:hypothetical protein [Actinomadura craniellae]|uniref:hypothetical protein n=1 Tax=Actinomadura craniellae TaxID=2231787 RepID=UPI001F2B7D18|nr:hypothetical protein [Actinomadura craniellae]
MYRRIGALTGVCCLLTGSAAPALAGTGKPPVAFTITDPRITESSGLAASLRHRGVVYTHNDSGAGARIFAVGPDGRTRAVLTLAGAAARDWEGIALGPDERGRPSLYVGDIGDNLGGVWPYITVYRVPEPARLRDMTLRPTTFRLRYADGPRNAEALLVHPGTGRLYVASKLFGGALYRGPARLRSDRTNTLTKVGSAPSMATDGAFSPDGRTFTLRTYFSAHVFAAPDKLLRVVWLPGQQQGESITYTPDGRSLLIGSEGAGQPVYRVALPAEALPPRPSPSSVAAPADPALRDTDGRRNALFIALAVGAALAYAVFRRRA